jgi:tight adherence protein B
MTPLVIALGGALCGAGLWLGVLGVLGRFRFTPPSGAARVGKKRGRWFTGTPRQLLGALAIGGITVGVTKWWSLFPIIVGGTAMFGGRFSKRGDVTSSMQAGEALAVWCERVRDTLAAGAGVTAAFHAAARSSHASLAGPATRLAERASSSGVAPALLEFGTEVNHPSADSMVMALMLAEQRGGKELISLLASEVESIRHELAVEREEDAVRSRYRTGVRIIVTVMLVSIQVFRLLSRSFLAPYDSFAGQIVLFVLGLIVLAALGRLAQLSQRSERERLFDPRRVVSS